MLAGSKKAHAGANGGNVSQAVREVEAVDPRIVALICMEDRNLTHVCRDVLWVGD